MKETTIRVLHYHYSWLPITEAWLYDLIRFLPSHVKSEIVCRKRVNESSFSLPRMKTGSVSALLPQSSARILHSHFGDFGWRNMEAARRAGVKHIVSFYGSDVNFLPKTNPEWKSRYKELFAHVDAVLCEGEHMAGCIERSLGCPARKLHVHRLGVDLKRIAYKPRSMNRSDRPSILLAGGFREKKGFPDALKAIALAIEQLGPIDITMIGDASPANSRMMPEKQRIMSTIRECGLTRYTRLLGFVPHERLWEEACKCHLFVSPSLTASDGDTEGGAPLTIIEMAASGMPIVSTNHCDIPATVGETNRALFVDERDVKGLANAIVRLFNLPSWESMLEENRRHAQRYFSAARQGERLARLYRRLLG